VNVHEERCIPWDPIPREYNRWSDLAVTNFGEVGVETTDGVACIILSFLPGEDFQHDHRWRIFFPQVLAYRLRPVVFGGWPEALPLTQPPKSWSSSGKGFIALWEIAPSVYVAQSVDPHMRDRAHHYVLVNHDMAYEVIALAASYRVEDLGEYERPIRQ